MAAPRSAWMGKLYPRVVSRRAYPRSPEGVHPEQPHSRTVRDGPVFGMAAEARTAAITAIAVPKLTDSGTPATSLNAKGRSHAHRGAAACACRRRRCSASDTGRSHSVGRSTIHRVIHGDPATDTARRRPPEISQMPSDQPYR